jgi:hypothetical protein
MTQLKVGLPDHLRSKLETAVEETSQSLGEEIRQRLERTFDEDRLPATTRKLIADIVELAEDVEIDQFAQWFLSPRAQEIFAVAVVARIKAYLPDGPDPLRNPDDQRDPYTVGLTIELLNRRKSSNERLRSGFIAFSEATEKIVRAAVAEHKRKGDDNDKA